MRVHGRRVVLSGGGEAALAKLRLLLKTTAHLTVFATDPAPQIVQWDAAGKLKLVRRAMAPGDTLCAALFYAADEDHAQDAHNAAIARADGALVRVRHRSLPAPLKPISRHACPRRWDRLHGSENRFARSPTPCLSAARGATSGVPITLKPAQKRSRRARTPFAKVSTRC